MNHLGDTNKMVDTPRTDAGKKIVLGGVGGDWQVVHIAFSRQLERELAAANDRIKRLEKTGDELRECASRIGTVASGEGSVIRRTEEAIQAWDKEVKL